MLGLIGKALTGAAGILACTSTSGSDAPQLAGASAQQPTVHVGDGSVDGSRLRPYDNVWLVSVRYDDGRRDERGLSSDHVRFRQIAGKKYLTRVEGTTAITGKPDDEPAAQFSMTFNVFDPLTLAPKRGEERASDGDRIDHQFDGARVTTRAHKPTEPAGTATTLALPEPVFDFNGGMTGLLLAALPLKVGYRAILPVLGENAFETAEIRVVREETIHAGYHGLMKTFVVEIGPPPSSSTYWISKSVPYVIRAQVTAAHAVASWDIVD